MMWVCVSREAPGHERDLGDGGDRHRQPIQAGRKQADPVCGQRGRGVVKSEQRPQVSPPSDVMASQPEEKLNNNKQSLPELHGFLLANLVLEDRR